MTESSKTLIRTLVRLAKGMITAIESWLEQQ